MVYRTTDGLIYHVLPDGAECTCTHRHPDDMDECPVCIAENDCICIPERCEYYTEHW